MVYVWQNVFLVNYLLVFIRKYVKTHWVRLNRGGLVKYEDSFDKTVVSQEPLGLFRDLNDINIQNRESPNILVEMTRQMTR